MTQGTLISQGVFSAPELEISKTVIVKRTGAQKFSQIWVHIPVLTLSVKHKVRKSDLLNLGVLHYKKRRTAALICNGELNNKVIESIKALFAAR